ncbi:thiopurine S-methyltransferase [Bordetella sp. FB-8]|uniref:thiopurine S-methyltransferase n=1 Tax=Bordetella sp. FB-8 TaxID=1159870 RepID=UPI000380DD34|nr:thiopurine S-methyltransferase [Bordetella sp. FB-8]
MDSHFWLERWRQGQTGFHMKKTTPLLAKYWPALGLARKGRVLVPLCGKSLDMLWLAGQGHQVLGVELSALAVEQFFAENRLVPQMRPVPAGTLYSAGDIQILCGDIFALGQADFAGCVAAYDRAALVALPTPMRERYARHVYGQLPAECRALLLTLEYDQQEMAGPPFAVLEEEVRTLYASWAGVCVLDRRGILDKEPSFAARGLTRLDTVVYELRRTLA